MYIALVILGIVAAALAVALLLSYKENARLRPFETETRVKDATIEALNFRIATLNDERQRADRAAEDRLTLLANSIMEKSAKESELRLGQILSPLTTDLKEFRAAVRQAYDNEARERFSLQNEIRNLMQAGQSISNEAKELSMALRGNSKVQGDWGEMILEQILEASGLKRGTHFELQVTTDPHTGQTLRNEQGAMLRPDAVVYYPRERCVVVDSKVSLTAYTRYVNATDEAERTAAGRQHVESLKGHIDALASKHYQDIVGTNRLDFVILLIPSEGAYLAAMNLDPTLWERAFAKRVVVASPTHLISMLRLLEQMWKQDSITKNVVEIGELSGRMIDKLALFIEEMENIDRALSAAQSSYRTAISRLSQGRGNIIATAHKIVDLGAKASKANRLPHPSDSE